jgi:hypothetical protein
MKKRHFILALLVPFLILGCGEIIFFTVLVGATGVNYASTATACTFTQKSTDDFSITFTGFSFDEIRDVRVEEINNGKTADSFTLYPVPSCGKTIEYVGAYHKKLTPRLFDTLRVTLPSQQQFYITDISLATQQYGWYRSMVGDYKCGVETYRIDGIESKTTYTNISSRDFRGLAMYQSLLISKDGIIPDRYHDKCDKKTILEEARLILNIADEMMPSIETLDEKRLLNLYSLFWSVMHDSTEKSDTVTSMPEEIKTKIFSAYNEFRLTRIFEDDENEILIKDNLKKVLKIQYEALKLLYEESSE